MKITFNDDSKFDLVPEATYVATCHDIRPNLDPGNKADGTAKTPYFSVGFKILDGDLAGRYVWQNYWLSPKSLWRVKQLMTAAGVLDENFSGEFTLVDDNGEFVPGALLAGTEVGIEVEHSTYNDKVSEGVTKVTKASEVLAF